MCPFPLGNKIGYEFWGFPSFIVWIEHNEILCYENIDISPLPSGIYGMILDMPYSYTTFHSIEYTEEGMEKRS